MTVEERSTIAEYVSTTEAARRLGCHPETVRRALEAGRLDGQRLARIWRVRAAQLDERNDDERSR